MCACNFCVSILFFNLRSGMGVVDTENLASVSTFKGLLSTGHEELSSLQLSTPPHPCGEAAFISQEPTLTIRSIPREPAQKPGWQEIRALQLPRAAAGNRPAAGWLAGWLAHVREQYGVARSFKICSGWTLIYPPQSNSIYQEGTKVSES